MLNKIMFTFSALLLSPALILQGLWVRKQARGLPEAQGPRQGELGAGKEIKLLIIGDSAGAGVGVTHQEQALSGHVVKHLSRDFKLKWKLIAATGYTTQDMLNNIAAQNTEDFDYVLISLGVNDVTAKVRLSTWLEQCDSLLKVLQEKYSPQSIIWSDIPPMEKFPALPFPLRWVLGRRKQQLRLALKHDLAKRENVILLAFPEIFSDATQFVADWMAADGFHPNEKMYALWGKLAAQKIKLLAK